MIPNVEQYEYMKGPQNDAGAKVWNEILEFIQKYRFTEATIIVLN